MAGMFLVYGKGGLRWINTPTHLILQTTGVTAHDGGTVA